MVLRRQSFSGKVIRFWRATVRPWAIASGRFRPRCRLCFEAKCLNRIAGVAEYLGPDGLGQFITGSYAANDPQADMQLTTVKISFERVDNFDACKREVLGIPRCDGQSELASRCGDETVFHRHGTPLFS